MFNKLRNRLIWINLGVTSVIIVTVFLGIYTFATNSAHNRPPVNEEYTVMSEDFERVINVTIENEKQAAARDLLVMLVISGLAIEIVVAVVSYFLGEEAIKPVREAYAAQKVFIANASHEIKTPLAAIAANLEAADITGNRWIDNVARETEKLAELNGELLTLARTDLAENRTETREVDLKELIAKELESFAPRLDGIDFKETLSIGSGRVRTNPEDLVQILRILLDNAIKYCDAKITLAVNGRELTVKNDGAKISAEDLPHVFERFYQTDKSAEGVGLGLSIAKALAERNHWELTASSGRMTTFTLQF